jgi:hypothetical protein
MPTQGDPNYICSTVKDKVVALLQANSDAATYGWTGLRGLDHDPVDSAFVTSTLPTVTVSFSYPKEGEYIDNNNMAMWSDFLTLKHYQRIGTNDAGGAVAEKGVRLALWLYSRYLTTNQTLWGTVATSAPFRQHVEDIPLEITKTTGVAARWGWIVFRVNSRVQPLY